MIMDGNRQYTLCLGLTNDIVVQYFADFLRRWHFALFTAVQRALGFFANDIVAKLHTFITDEHSGPSDQLANFMLRFSAERTIKGAFRI